MTVAAIGRRMSSREITEWLAYFQIEAEDAAERVKRADLAEKAKTGMQGRRGKRGGG